MISIKDTINISALNHLYSELDQQNAASRLDLSMGLNLKFNTFSAFVCFIQFIFTWKRKANAGSIILQKRAVTYLDVEKTVREHTGFVISVVGWKNGIFDADGNDLKPHFKKANAILLKLFQESKWTKSSYRAAVLFPAIDHVPPEQGLFDLFYIHSRSTNTYNLAPESAYELLTLNLIESTTENNEALKVYYSKIAGELKGVLFELFENTHKFARKSSSGDSLTPGLRGVYSKLFNFEYKRLRNFTDNSPALERYFSEIHLRNPESITGFRNVSFLEISVFDSGSGIVRVYKKKELIGKSIDDIPIGDEFTYLIEALKKNNTSHKGILGKESRGVGLYRMMEIVSKANGFLRIRTGRLDLFRNFLSVPFYEPRNDTFNYSLFNWDSQSVIATQLQDVSGTSISIIMPCINPR
ncbi:MAG: hypothetical protein ACMVP2_03275 [Imperialibacter sp.]|uniref:hypothetical protein n=1 Tax=Imperialibacter sp. TaxID=2038411 RepID=UPI003A870064